MKMTCPIWTQGITPIHSTDIVAVDTAFNVFIYDAVGAENRTHSFPDNELHVMRVL